MYLLKNTIIQVFCDPPLNKIGDVFGVFTEEISDNPAVIHYKTGIKSSGKICTASKMATKC